MKKILGIIVLGLLLSGNAYSEDFVYNCKFKTSYKNDTGKKLKSTNDKYTIKNLGDTHINIFWNKKIEGVTDKGLSQGNLKIISNTNQFIRAVGNKTDNLHGIIINKETGYIQIALLHGSGETSVKYGFCKK